MQHTVCSYELSNKQQASVVTSGCSLSERPAWFETAFRGPGRDWPKTALDVSRRMAGSLPGLPSVQESFVSHQQAPLLLLGTSDAAAPHLPASQSVPAEVKTNVGNLPRAASPPCLQANPHMTLPAISAPAFAGRRLRTMTRMRWRRAPRGRSAAPTRATLATSARARRRAAQHRRGYGAHITLFPH